MASHHRCCCVEGDPVPTCAKSVGYMSCVFKTVAELDETEEHSVTIDYDISKTTVTGSGTENFNCTLDHVESDVSPFTCTRLNNLPTVNEPLDCDVSGGLLAGNHTFTFDDVRIRVGPSGLGYRVSVRLENFEFIHGHIAAFITADGNVEGGDFSTSEGDLDETHVAMPITLSGPDAELHNNDSLNDVVTDGNGNVTTNIASISTTISGSGSCAAGFIIDISIAFDWNEDYDTGGVGSFNNDISGTLDMTIVVDVFSPNPFYGA